MDANERDLVEREGVSAGSARIAAEDVPPGGDVIGGGHPERAAEQAGQREDAQIVDAPFMPRDPDAPSLEQSEEEAAAERPGAGWSATS